jgi:hypothetical protein
MTISTLVLSLLALAVGNPPSLASLSEAPPASLMAMGALGVFNTALAYYVYFRLVHDEGPTFASLNNYSCRSSASSTGRWRSPNRSRPRLGRDFHLCCAEWP